MNDLIRSTIYTGVGAMVLARKKAEEYVEELIQNNHLTQDEGQRVVHELIHLLEDARTSAEHRWQHLVDEGLLKFGLPGRHELEARWSEFLSKIRSGRLAGTDKPVATEP